MLLCISLAMRLLIGFQRDVTIHAQALLGREDRTSPFPPGTVATAGDVQAWESCIVGRCCTSETFRLDFSSTPCSKWNASATQVFVNSFLQAETYDCTDPKMISLMFRRHFRTLRKHYRSVSGNPQPQQLSIEEYNIIRARWQRKYSVCFILCLVMAGESLIILVSVSNAGTMLFCGNR